MSLFAQRIRPKDLQMARSERFLTHHWDIPKHPGRAYLKARFLIQEAGWGFKSQNTGTRFSRMFTVTMNHNIWLSESWEEYPVWKKAMILWHELVHIRQRQEWGHTRFLLRYMTPRGRWAIEVPAYRMSIRVCERLSQGEFNSTAYIHKKINSFRQNYRLQLINYPQYKTETLIIWNYEKI